MSKKSIKKTIVEISEPEPEGPPPESEDEETPIAPLAKPKRVCSEAQKEHLNIIREKAIARKKELSEITLKAKLGKNIEKVQQAQKYDDYVKSIPQKEKKPKIVYQEESEEEEVVVVKKKAPIVHQQQDESFNTLLYKTAIERMQEKIIDERIRNSINSYANALFPQSY